MKRKLQSKDHQGKYRRGLQSAVFEMPKIWAHDFFLETHISKTA